VVAWSRGHVVVLVWWWSRGRRIVVVQSYGRVVVWSWLWWWSRARGRVVAVAWSFYRGCGFGVFRLVVTMCS